MFILVITEKFERHIVTIGCGEAVLVIVFGFCLRSWQAAWYTLNIQNIFTLDFWYSASESAKSSSGINWATILFIAGMMIMVEGMASAGFFVFMIMSAILEMFIDSITVILFLAEIFCANLGGSATMCGDPPNIIIGTALGYSFSDFINNTGMIAGISLFFVVLYFWFCFAKKLKKSEAYLEQIDSFPDPSQAILNRTRFIQSTLIFLLAIVLLVSHAYSHLTVAFIGVFIALLTLVCAGSQAGDLLKQLDYKTLLFFVGLFVVVGGLEETGVLEIVTEWIANWSNGIIYLMVLIILWVSAVASAIVDNIPFAATMIPIIQMLAQSQSVPLTAVAMNAGYPISLGQRIVYRSWSLWGKHFERI